MKAIPIQTTLKAALGCLAAMLLLSGCAAVGPDFKKPDLPTPEGWLETADPRLSTEEGDYRDWWKSFADPALEALIQRAYQDNLALEIAGLRVYEARAQLGVAVGTLYPQRTQAYLSYEYFNLSENAEPISYLPPLVQEGVKTDFSNYRLGFGTVWELDFWGKFRRIVEAADASLAAQIAAYDTVLVTVTGELASAYILLRTLEQQLEVARSNADIQRRSAEIADVRRRNELASELDVVQAEVQLKNTEASIPRLEAALREVENALSMLLGAAPGEVRTIIGGAADIPATPTSVAVGLPADLLRRRPDIRQAEYLAAFQSARIGITKAELYPSFRLGGTIGYAAEDLSDLFKGGSVAGLFGAGFSWNILNFGRIKNRVRANDARFQQALANYEAVLLNALREVENAQNGFLRAQEEVALLAGASQTARRAVDLALVRYSDGIADFTRVLTAQRALELQEGRLTDARGRVARNLIDIYRALGGGWQIREGEDFIPADAKDAMRERTNWGDLLEAGAVEPVPEAERGRWRAPDR
ncbi:MAG: efflux transporter outer membrane subunit [Desulfobacterales bacterium]